MLRRYDRDISLNLPIVENPNYDYSIFMYECINCVPQLMLN